MKYPWERIGETADQAEARRQTCLIAWREEYPGQPDPDNAALCDWLIEGERAMLLEEWRSAHPGRQVPDYPEVRRWAINERNQQALDHLRERGESFH
jgi:hypothetical protein